MEVLASEEGFKVGGGDIGAAIMSLVIQFFLSERIPKAYSDNSGKKTRIVDLGMEGNRGGGGGPLQREGLQLRDMPFKKHSNVHVWLFTMVI